MINYSTNEFKIGLKIIVDGYPCNILSNEFVKPGKGQAFNRVKLKNLKNGKIWEKTFKSGEKVEVAQVNTEQMQYLYKDGNNWVFMLTDGSFEQKEVDSKKINDIKQWLIEEEIYEITSWNKDIIQIVPPNNVELEVIETDPGVRGDTVSGGSKPATLSTGAVVKVPLFINIGEIIKIDTRNSVYISRA